MTLFQLLTHVQQGKTINFDSLKKQLPKGINWHSLFEPVMTGANKYHVTILDRAQFDEILNKAEPAKTRAEAAAHQYQSSHAVNCDSAYMLCYPARQRVLHVAATLDNRILCLAFSPARYALLIENQDCFFKWESLLEELQTDYDIDDCDIYYSAGKRILNTRLMPILTQYERFICAFDYDLEGLTIAHSLQVKLKIPSDIILPVRLTSCGHLFTFAPKSITELTKMTQLCQILHVPELGDLVQSTQHFMEQEALLLNS